MNRLSDFFTDKYKIEKRDLPVLFFLTQKEFANNEKAPRLAYKVSKSAFFGTNYFLKLQFYKPISL